MRSLTLKSWVDPLCFVLLLSATACAVFFYCRGMVLQGWSVAQSAACECGGIGIRAGFRFQWGNPWEFESPHSHHTHAGCAGTLACRV